MFLTYLRTQKTHLASWTVSTKLTSFGLLLSNINSQTQVTKYCQIVRSWNPDHPMKTQPNTLLLGRLTISVHTCLS